MPQIVHHTKLVDTVMSGPSVAARLVRGALLVGAVLLLGGCVTSVGYESPYDGESTGAGIYQPPPQLPTDAQPPCPGDGYLWIPGYWAYSNGYYWVPGSWVLPPAVGLLWTPGYWGFAGGAYVWHAGHWGPHVGFYGGVHYGFGYDGVGYRGGRWEGRHFVYNRHVTNVDDRVVRYTYDERVHRTFDGDRASYDRGRGRLVADPTRESERYAHEPHPGITSFQHAHIDHGAVSPGLFARENGGRPAPLPTPHPGRLQGPGADRAPGAEGFRPQGGWPNSRPQANFASRPNFPQSHAAAPAGPRYQAPRPFDSRPPVARPLPGPGTAARLGPAARPRGRPAPEKEDRTLRHPRP